MKNKEKPKKSCQWSQFFDSHKNINQRNSAYPKENTSDTGVNMDELSAKNAYDEPYCFCDIVCDILIISKKILFIQRYGL